MLENIDKLMDDIAYLKRCEDLLRVILNIDDGLFKPRCIPDMIKKSYYDDSYINEYYDISEIINERYLNND